MPKLRDIIDREVLWHDPRRIHIDVALRCTPAIVAIILAGAMLHQPTAAAIMCGSALTVGSGVYQRIGQSQIAPMLAATIGMAVSAAIGTLAGLSLAPLVVAVLLWGCVSGLLPALGSGGQWIGQQCVIALLVASSFPGTLDHALGRAGLLVAGGAVQIVIIETTLRFSDIPIELKGWRETVAEAKSAWRTLQGTVRDRSIYLHFSLRVAVTLAAAVITEQTLKLPNGYWVGMTTVLLLRLEFHDTWHRSASRVGGTVSGATIAILAAWAGAPAWALAAAIPVTAFFGFAIQQFSYAAFSACLTAYIVLLLTYAGLQEQVVAHNRIIGTMIGAGFALLGHLHFLAWRRQVRQWVHLARGPMPTDASSRSGESAHQYNG